jgi:hypothetical protein
VLSAPPAELPYFGSWSDPTTIYAMNGGQRVTMKADELRGVFMPNPKDVRIAELESQLERLQRSGDAVQ